MGDVLYDTSTDGLRREKALSEGEYSIHLIVVGRSPTAFSIYGRARARGDAYEGDSLVRPFPSSATATATATGWM